MTKVLVVDDSALMRRLLTGVLDEAGFEVSTARNGAEGVAKLDAWQPDVVTLDVNMPEMDGLTALSLMMQVRPTPVVMVSSLTTGGATATFEALALGATDFVAKPGGTISLSVDEIAQELIDKVSAAARARRPARPLAAAAARATAPPGAARPTPRQIDAVAPSARTGEVDGVVLIGVSTGGPQTLEAILPRLPASFRWPILVAQHMPPTFTDAFAKRMDRLCALTVREVGSTQPLQAGNVYIGQGGTDMALVRQLGRLAVQPCPETPGHPWHPSADVLVDSAMRLLPPERIVGVLLTGMGNDGARTMTELRRRGGRTIAESEDSAVVFGMPQELIRQGGAGVVLRAEEVARQLGQWIK